MRTTTQQTKDAWKNPIKAGESRPCVRATIEWGRVRNTAYNTDDMQGGDFPQFNKRMRKGVFRAINFGNNEMREIRNIRTFSWSRSVDQDVAEATLTLLNTDVTPIGDITEVAIGDDFDLPGIFTFSRGAQEASATRWGYTTDTGWNEQLVPDRLIRTYEGYGSDDNLAPGLDPHLYASGVWLIDEVDYNANGDITIKMRDLGRLLIDHIVFPPVVPRDDYPLEWSKIRQEQIESRDAKGGRWAQPHGKTYSSNNLYVGEGLVDTPRYVNAQGGVQGHYSQHAWRAGRTRNKQGKLSGKSNEKYWLSTGQDNHRDLVWWEIDLNKPIPLAALQISGRSGPYRVYISVHDGTRWLGSKRISYTPTTGGVNIRAGIKFVKSIKSEHDAVDVILPRVYRNAKKIRLTFSRLRMLTPAVNYPWRAGLRNLELYTADRASDLYFGKGFTTQPIGNYRDFSEIVRWVGAWAGWYWPLNATMKYETNGVKLDYSYSTQFVSALPKGRTWGHFERNGTAGIADITADQFDKQPLMDVIAHVREITGSFFWIDEAGGMVYRLPNLIRKGNWITPSHLAPFRLPNRTFNYITLDENDTLISYNTVLSSKNVRERVFVGDTQGKVGAVVKGYSPHGGTGLMRIAGWTDGNFKTNRECYVAADLILALQMFDYRRARITTPGNPAIQIDDQIRVFERTTNETYFHYVIGVSSEINMEDGTWDYNLETHWLGEDIDTAFVLDATKLGGPTKQYLALSGGLA